MSEPSPPDAQLLLQYAQAIYGEVTGQRRRLAAALLAVALLFALVALVAGVRWAALDQAAADVQDAALVEALGVRLPDPRPALERAELRLRAFGWAMVALGSGSIAAIAGGLYLLVRPKPLPPELRALGRPPG